MPRSWPISTCRCCPTNCRRPRIWIVASAPGSNAGTSDFLRHPDALQDAANRGVFRCAAAVRLGAGSRPAELVGAEPEAPGGFETPGEGLERPSRHPQKEMDVDRRPLS